MSDSPLFVFLDILTWQGLSIGAMHYYGTLEWGKGQDRRKEKLLRPLPPDEVAELSENRATTGLACDYEAWEYTEIFNSWTELVENALNVYRDVVPDANYLVLGEPPIGDPQYILDGDDEALICTANEIYEEFENINGFGCTKENEPKAEALSREWDRLMGRRYYDQDN